MVCTDLVLQRKNTFFFNYSLWPLNIYNWHSELNDLPFVLIGFIITENPFICGAIGNPRDLLFRNANLFWKIPRFKVRLFDIYISLKTYAAISNAHLSRVRKRGKLSGSCLSTLNRFGSTQLPIFLCHIGVPTFSSQNN